MAPAQTESSLVIYQSELTKVDLIATHKKLESYANGAVNKANELLTLAKAGMTDELDAKMKTLVDMASNKLDECQEERKKVTKIFDNIRSEFTSKENLLDKTKPGVILEVTKARDAYAKLKIQAANLERQKAEEKRMAAEEKAQIKSTVQKQIEEGYVSHLNKNTAMAKDLYDSFTIESPDGAKTMLSSMIKDLKASGFAPAISIGGVRFTSHDDIKAIKSEVALQVAPSYRDRWDKDIKAVVTNYLDMIPGKLELLKKEAEANEAEKAKLEKKRLADEATREHELTTKQAADATQAQNVIESELVSNVAEAHAAEASVVTDVGKVKESVSIVVLKPQGYVLLLSLYLQQNPMLTVEEVVKKTLKSVKGFCEKYAMQSTEIIESPLLDYQIKYKAK